MEAHNDHMSPITQPGAPAVGQLDEATALAIVRGVTAMIVNCKDFLVFPNSNQWKVITSRVDVVEQKLDSLAEEVDTRFDAMNTQLRSQLTTVISQLTEMNARWLDVDQRLTKSDIKFEAL
ncbi:hypothetical protein E4U13_003426 [Claviceps humidiphila]|uniref:Uncharacterized protein n=1 Tax=Claviceps humidiphila TaxID=1294629 RepID=A0A9P7TTT1_9HYPO|nr:hypothetical protein E4U13_003426 [Claviceps humidiphila]